MLQSIYANPVEITKKDIYIIKNKINSKVYIGQASNVALRFKQHCKKSNYDNSIIGKAIKRYGKENFWYELLETQVADYNDREKFWIGHYNSAVPNGYNILQGGDSPPVMHGDIHPNTKITDCSVMALKKDLRDTETPLSQLALKYGISKKQLIRINQGVSRAVLGEEYPIRRVPNINGKLTEEDVGTIIDLLRFTYFLNGEIARRFGVDVHAISKINDGLAHRRPDIKYPIRDWKSSGVVLLTYEQVTEIISLLKNSDLSLNQIAKKYDVYVQPIQQINNGSAKKYRRSGIVYPIRRF